MNRKLVCALLGITLLAVGLVAAGAPATAEARSCEPDIPCSCCFVGCDQAYDNCIASGQSQTVCSQQRTTCYRQCRFCV